MGAPSDSRGPVEEEVIGRGALEHWRWSFVWWWWLEPDAILFPAVDSNLGGILRIKCCRLIIFSQIDSYMSKNCSSIARSLRILRLRRYVRRFNGRSLDLGITINKYGQFLLATDFSVGIATDLACAPSLVGS